MNKYALIFPGQGSQKLGMLSDYYEQYSNVRQTFDEASEALQLNVWKLIQEDAARLAQTEYTQPALLASSVAIYRVLNEKLESKPLLMAGHSLGEYSALVCAGALDFSDALKLVKARGRFMQEAVPPGTGAMSAIIGLADELVKDVCEEVGQVDAANFNAPGQVVISGESEAVEKANLLAKEKGAKMAKLLPVSVPSHCLLMKPAAEKLADVLNQIQVKAPQIPVIHNVDVDTHTNPDAIKEVLVSQLYQSVRWTETIQTIAAEGVINMVECGPNKVLTGLNKRIDKSIQSYNTDAVGDLEQLLETTGV